VKGVAELEAQVQFKD